MKNILLFATFLFCSFFTNAQQCGNIDFEAGNINGWICRSGTYGSTGTGTPATCGPDNGPTLLPTQGVLNAGGNNAPVWGANDRHVLINQAGNDPNSLGTVSYVAPANLFPTGYNNKFSFRLGNGVANGLNGLAEAESIEYSFLVTQQNAGLTYMYAAFLVNANPDHLKWESPRFEIRITRKINGIDSVVNCGKYQVIAGDGTGSWKTGAAGPTPGTNWKYTDWTRVGLDLTSFIGQTLKIQFITSDCFPNNDLLGGCKPGPGAHSAYAYFDLYCAPLKIDAQVICANASSITACAPPGYTNYKWPAGQPGITGSPTTQCVTINSPQAGVTYTVNMTSLAGTCNSFATVKLAGVAFNVKDTIVCAGSPPFTLDVVPVTPSNYNYSWLPATGLSCTTCEDPIVTPSSTKTYTVVQSDAVINTCAATKTVTVFVNPTPTPQVADATICKGGTTTLTATGAVTYSWSPSTGLNTTTGSSVNAKPTSDQTYTVIGASAANCTASTQVTVKVFNCMFVLAHDTTVCEGSCAILKASTNSGTPPYTFTWVGGTNMGAVCPAVTTDYTVTVTDVNGNTASDILTVTIEPKPIIQTTPVQVCFGNCATITASGAAKYSWSPSTGLNTTTGNSVMACKLVTDQQYTISGTSTFGCTNINTVSVKVNYVTVLALGDTICAGEEGLMKAYGALTYTWMPGNYSGTPAKIPATVTTVYTVTGTDGLGCTNSTTATLLVYPVPLADFTPDPATTSIDEPTIRFYNKSTNGHIFYWELGDGSTDSLTDVQHKYDKPGTYRVCLTARNQWNCESQVCKEVVILPEWSFYVPDAFSPNGDGKNDGFIGVGINVIQYEMWIFDRWGNKIYHCKSMNEPWDGRRDNNPSNDVAQEDVYVWRIKIKDVFDKKHEYIGHVTLVK